MAVPEPGCCDGPNDLLRKILLGLDSISDGMGGGDVVGPAGAVDGDISIFDGATGKIIEDSGVNISQVNLTLQSGSQNIGAAVDTISVVFPVAFASLPDVVLTISRPAAEDIIQVNIDDASLTVAGFTASLSATTGSANYKLKWMAN